MTEAHLLNLCIDEKNGKISLKLRKNMLGFQPNFSLFSVLGISFYFGASITFIVYLSVTFAMTCCFKVTQFDI